MPILSQSPFARTASLSMSISWYFKDELPAFITKIFIYFIPFINSVSLTATFFPRVRKSKVQVGTAIVRQITLTGLGLERGVCALSNGFWYFCPYKST